MAIAYQSVTTDKRSGAGSNGTPSTAKPTSLAAGDYCIWAVFTSSVTNVTPPAGFVAFSENPITIYAGGGKLLVFHKLCDGTESDPLSGSMTSDAWLCIAIRFTGTRIGKDVSAKGTNGTASSSNYVIPSLTTTYANEIIVLFQGSVFNGGTYTPDAALTELVDDNQNTVYAEVTYQTTTTATSYGSWTNVNTGSESFDSCAAYFKVAIGENLWPSKLPSMLKINQAVKRRSFY